MDRIKSSGGDEESGCGVMCNQTGALVCLFAVFFRLNLYCADSLTCQD